MNQKGSTNYTNQDKIHSLTKAIEHYTSVTHDFKEAYHQLEQQVMKLNIELEEKNSELCKSLTETKSLKNYLYNILSSMNSGVVCTDSEENVTVFNRAAETLTGFSAQHVIGKKYSSLFVDDRSKGYQPKDMLKNKDEIIKHEKLFRCSNGKSLPVKFCMCRLQSENEEPLGIVEVFEDLTEFRKLENEIQQGRTLMALGEMAGHVAHQIRNPLGAIAGFTTLLERDLGSEDSRQRHTRKIIEAVGNMERIIGNLVFLARPVQPSKRKINIRWLLNDVVEHILFQSKEEGKKIHVDRKMPKSKIEMMADPHLFQQLFIHLLRNSVQAIERTGEIKLQLRKSAKNEIRLTIADNGKGIPSEIQNRLFHPFESNKQKGVGLGLPIVRKIVDLHQGQIQIKSKINKGTKVTLIIQSGL